MVERRTRIGGMRRSWVQSPSGADIRLILFLLKLLAGYGQITTQKQVTAVSAGILTDGGGTSSDVYANVLY